MLLLHSLVLAFWSRIFRYRLCWCFLSCASIRSSAHWKQTENKALHEESIVQGVNHEKQLDHLSRKLRDAEDDFRARTERMQAEIDRLFHGAARERKFGSAGLLLCVRVCFLFPVDSNLV
jgi:hypothetical protein